MTENNLAETLSDTSVGDYVLTDKIGSGGYGTVYRGYHKEQPDKIVAIKIVGNKDQWEIETYDPKIIEVRNLAELSGHPNIVNIRDYFFSNKDLVVVMEYINGTNLTSFLDENARFSSQEAIDFLFQMADALKYAHAKNIVHRDIKLSNIIVSDEGNRKKYVLVDFGISRSMQGIQTEKHVGGTHYFMSPEQLKGRFGKESDLWAIGVVTYMLLTGKKPFTGETLADLAQNILFNTPESPSSLLELMNPDLEKILFQLLEKQGINRISSAEQLHKILTEHFDRPVLSVEIQTVPATRDINFETTWERQQEKKTKKALKKFWIFAVFSLITPNIIGQLIQIYGYILFYKGEERKKNSMSNLGVILIFFSFMFSWIQSVILSNLGRYNEIILISNMITSLLTMFTMWATLYYLAKYKHFRRELFIIRSLIKQRDKENYLTEFKNFVNIYPGDFYIHIRYIETLFLYGRHQDAVVESLIFLESDPYNKDVCLLLANGYYDLRLYADCIQVCDGYLAIAGYSFEFYDLKNECNKLTRII